MAEGDGFDDAAAVLAELDLTTAGIAEMLPGVLPPLVWDVASHLVEEAFRHVFGELGALPDDLIDRRGLLRRVEGRAALDFGRLSTIAAALPGGRPEELEDQYFGSRREGRAPAAPGERRHARLRGAAHDLRVLGTRRRAALDGDIVITATTAVVAARTELTAVDDRSLLAHHLRLLDLATRTAAAELAVAADAAATYRRLEVVLSGPLGPDEAGLTAQRCTTRAGGAIAVDPRASAAVVAGPTWEELGRTVPAAPEPAARPASAKPGAVLDEALLHATGWDPTAPTSWLRRRAMGFLAGEATTQLARREATKASLLALGGELRRTHLEMGARLAARGVLGDALEVDLLSLAELRDAVAGGEAPSLEVIGHRRESLARVELDGPLPSRFHGVPDRARPAPSRGDRLDGWAVSPGTYRGRAVVLRSPDDPLPRGAVLVAATTDPSWMAAFAAAGAVVLERGGPLSHAAIVARELGIPAVLNVPGATERLDGRLVDVDGGAGVVHIIDGVDGGSDVESVDRS